MVKSAKSSKWRLDDAEARAKKNPYTFWQPSSQLIAKLRPNDFAKLIFLLNERGEDEPEAERMWVSITNIDGNSFLGHLDNQPKYIPELTPGTPLQFEAKHIIDASIDDPVPDPTRKWHERCFVTNRILDGESPVGYFYRESPDQEGDSGWRFLSGNETDGYIEKNTQYVSLGAVLRCDDRMVGLLDHPAPVTFVWDEKNNRFAITEDSTNH